MTSYLKRNSSQRGNSAIVSTNWVLRAIRVRKTLTFEAPDFSREAFAGSACSAAHL